MREKAVSEEGSVVIEATIYFPIVIILILTLIIYGTMMYQLNLLQTSANQIAVLCTQQLRDSSFSTMFNGNLDQDINHVDYSNTMPYRYIIPSSLTKETLSKLEKIANNTAKNIKLEISQDNYFVSSYYTVKLKQEFQSPISLNILGITNYYQLCGTSRVLVTDPAEFIRNIDIVFDTVKKLDNRLEFSERINEIFEKAKVFINRSR